MPLFGLFRRKDKETEKAVEEVKEKTAEGTKKAREGWFSRMASLFRQPYLDDDFWSELEDLLVAADAGMDTTDNLLDDLHERTVNERMGSPSDLFGALKDDMVKLLSVPGTGSALIVPEGDMPRPLVISVVGVNGVGKTTSIAKLAASLKSQGRTVVLGACDTFRAAALEQLQAWAERVGVEVIAHKAGSDPGGVAYDAVNAAKARNADVLILDTAGRLHTKKNLMAELDKVHRVVGRLMEGAPHEVLLVLDATTGQNGLIQARTFSEIVSCTGVFLTKMDGTAKGGIVLAIAQDLQLPVLFIGTGEGVEDMTPFDPEAFVDSLFAEPSTPSAH